MTRSEKQKLRNRAYKHRRAVESGEAILFKCGGLDERIGISPLKAPRPASELPKNTTTPALEAEYVLGTHTLDYEVGDAEYDVDSPERPFRPEATSTPSGSKISRAEETSPPLGEEAEDRSNSPSHSAICAWLEALSPVPESFLLFADLNSEEPNYFEDKLDDPTVPEIADQGRRTRKRPWEDDPTIRRPTNPGRWKPIPRPILVESPERPNIRLPPSDIDLRRLKEVAKNLLTNLDAVPPPNTIKQWTTNDDPTRRKRRRR